MWDFSCLLYIESYRLWVKLSGLITNINQWGGDCWIVISQFICLRRVMITSTTCPVCREERRQQSPIYYLLSRYLLSAFCYLFCAEILQSRAVMEILPISSLFFRGRRNSGGVMMMTDSWTVPSSLIMIVVWWCGVSPYVPPTMLMFVITTKFAAIVSPTYILAWRPPTVTNDLSWHCAVWLSDWVTEWHAALGGYRYYR